VSTRANVALAIAVVVIVAGLGGYYLSVNSVNGQNSTSTTGSATSNTNVGSLTTVSGADWTTYHHDNSRTGNAGAVSVSTAEQGWVSQGLDGRVYAEPLAFDGEVLVATENDSVYALSAQTGAVVWRTHVGTPVSGSTLPCGDIDPSGITGTPVIDPATGVMYLVAFESPASHTLVALNTANGKVVFTRPADPSGADPRVEQQRAALSLANGMVYWLFGGLDGDCGQYHGWVVGLNLNGTGNILAYQVPTNREGGIWGPSGAVVDSAGDVFVATGNGDSSTSYDHGDSVIELSPTLQELGYFAPSNWAQLNQADADLGSAGPAAVGQGLLFQIGKEGVGYLLNSTNLGGIGGQVFSKGICSSAFGGVAASGDDVFVPCTDGLVEIALSGQSFTTAWRAPSFPAGPPIVTGNVVWTLDVSTGMLHGFDVTTGKALFSFNTGQVTRFTTPMSAYGELFVAAGDAVYSFTLAS
jgi:outer membrane protein assembly factor BamB